MKGRRCIAHWCDAIASLPLVILRRTPLHRIRPCPPCPPPRTPSAQDQVDALSAALMDQWRRFLARHPDFTGTIGLAAHSLGSVLSYDILCNQPEDPAAAAAAAGAGG